MSPELCEVAGAVEAGDTLCLCVSTSFNACTMCRIAAGAAEEVNACIIPVLLDHAKPSRGIKGVAPLLACIDFIDTESFDLGVMELAEEIGICNPAEPHSFDMGFGAVATPPTIAFTNLGGRMGGIGSISGGIARGQSPRSSTSASNAISWEGYDASFMHGQRDDDASEASWAVDTRTVVWDAPDEDDEEEGGYDSDDKTEDGFGPTESSHLSNLPLDRVASVISAEVSSLPSAFFRLSFTLACRALLSLLRCMRPVCSWLMDEPATRKVCSPCGESFGARDDYNLLITVENRGVQVSKRTAPLEARVAELEARLASRRALLAELQRECMS